MYRSCRDTPTGTLSPNLSPAKGLGIDSSGTKSQTLVMLLNKISNRFFERNRFFRLDTARTRMYEFVSHFLQEVAGKIFFMTKHKLLWKCPCVRLFREIQKQFLLKFLQEVLGKYSMVVLILFKISNMTFFVLILISFLKHSYRKTFYPTAVFIETSIKCPHI